MKVHFPKKMEMPLKRVFFAFNSPQRRPRALPGHHSATIRHLQYVAMVPGLRRVSGIRGDKGALRGYKRYKNRQKSVLSHIGLRIAPIWPPQYEHSGRTSHRAPLGSPGRTQALGPLELARLQAIKNLGHFLSKSRSAKFTCPPSPLCRPPLPL